MSAFVVAAATGYSSHKLDFVSESYGGAKPKNMPEEVNKKKDSSESLWDAVRRENIQIVNTKRVSLCSRMWTKLMEAMACF